jgi:hypothetical protein
MIREAIAALVDGRSLTEAEAAALRTSVTLSPPQRTKGPLGTDSSSASGGLRMTGARGRGTIGRLKS